MKITRDHISRAEGQIALIAAHGDERKREIESVKRIGWWIGTAAAAQFVALLTLMFSCVWWAATITASQRETRDDILELKEQQKAIGRVIASTPKNP